MRVATAVSTVRDEEFETTLAARLGLRAWGDRVYAPRLEDEDDDFEEEGNSKTTTKRRMMTRN